MKAKDYVEKYKGRILAFDYIPDVPIVDDESRAVAVQEMNKMAEGAIAEMFKELIMEAEEMIRVRNAQSATAKISVYREINDKWNSIADRINKLYPDQPVLKPNAMKNFWISEIPALADLWNAKDIDTKRAAKMSIPTRKDKKA